MINSKEFRLVELLCSKLCHDLIGPIGKVSDHTPLLTGLEQELKQEAPTKDPRQ